MERESDRPACAACGADVAAHTIKFQGENGAPLCERCYAVSRGARGGPIASAGAIVVVLRLAAYGILAMTVLSILMRMSVPDFAIIHVAVYGTLAFLLFIGLGEGLGILLALHRQALENGMKLDRMLASSRRACAPPSLRPESQTL